MKTFVRGCLLVLLLSFSYADSYEDSCSIYDKHGKDSRCNSDPDLDSGKYTKTVSIGDKWRIYQAKIDTALAAYVKCEFTNCSCFVPNIERDLQPFMTTGITQKMISKARDYGTYYQIVNHKLYRDAECMFPSRCKGIEHFIKQLLLDLPDMELIINTRDWPQVNRHFPDVLPVFSFSKSNSYYDIIYPAWAFWEGGPAISLYPMGIGRWDLHRELLRKTSKQFTWHKKKSQAYFRGSRTSSERDPLILLSRENPQLVDAQYTKNQAWKSPADTLNAEPAKEVSFEDHCKYKYLFNFRGVAASFRFKYLFLCGSLVFHVGQEWEEFFYPQMLPWIHYIPLNQGSSKEEMKNTIQFALENDNISMDIAKRGRDFVWHHLHMDNILCYWKELLLQYAKLMQFIPKRNKNLVEIR